MSDKLGQEITKELAEKVITHRNNFYEFFMGKYMEGLTALFSYQVGKPVNSAKIELALRSGLAVAYGKNKLGNDCILGYVKNDNTLNNNSIDLCLRDRIATGKDIQYIIPESIRLPVQREITELDDCAKGDFTIIRNKDLWLVNDYDIIRHYADELAEIVASRFSLIIQSKVMTVFYGEVGNESLEQMIANLYNGSPVLKASKLFDVEDNMFTIENPNLANTLQQLKTEYQNKIAELNALFGVNVLAVSKESGVTESESNGNLSYVKTNLNTYLRPRQKAFELYNRRYGTNYKVTPNFQVELGGK